MHLKGQHIKKLIESYEDGRYNVYELNDEGISHFIVKDNEKIDKHDGEVPFVSLEECRNYLRTNKKIQISSAKKINTIIPEIQKPLPTKKKAYLKTIDGVLEEIELSLNDFKEGKLMTADMETRLNVYQQAVNIHAFKFAKDKFEYIKENKFSEGKLNRLRNIGGNGHK